VKYFFLFLIVLSATTVIGQTTSDTLALPPVDSTVVDDQEYNYYTGEEEEEEEEKDSDAPADSLQISHRSFPPDVVESLKSDSDLQYEKLPTVAESLWDRLMNFIAYIFRRLFEATTQTSIGNLLLYIVGIAVLVILIMVLLKVDAFKIFYGKQATGAMGATVFEENIHEMDFEALIRKATLEQDYRKGVRLVFLYALKILADRHLISWEQGKTNHDYVAELKTQELKNGLNELSYYFDYAWYGNFKVSPEIFNKVQGIFTAWRGNLR
jgi:hypothetical protein